MDEKEKKKISRYIMVITGALAIAVLAFIIYTLVVRKTIGVEYYVVITVFLIAYWLLTNVVEVVLTKELEEKTTQQVKAYKIYAAMNFAGLAGLGYFAMSMNNNNGGMIGALIYVAAMMGKKRYWEEYMGITHDEDGEEEAEDNSEDNSEACLTDGAAEDAAAETEIVQDGTMAADDREHDNSAE